METSASIGIAFASGDEDVPEQLLHSADLAMYQAKRKGGAGYQTINTEEQALIEQGANLQRDLRQACGRAELRVEYQPIVSTANARIIAVEALVRWDHPTLGLVPPSTLIPLAEHCGIIAEIGRWVLEQACLDLCQWRDQFEAATLDMSVNVSASQLMSADFARTVEDVLLRTGIDARLLILEVTETIFVQDQERALVVLSDLRRLGVRVALDDFGSGYSSLSYLKRIPVDLVKVDPGFVADLRSDRASHAILSAIAHLAHALGLTVTAEGVETVLQHEAAAALSIDACQGYYFARPMRADAVAALMGRRVSGGNARLPELVLSS